VREQPQVAQECARTAIVPVGVSAVIGSVGMVVLVHRVALVRDAGPSGRTPAVSYDAHRGPATAGSAMAAAEKKWAKRRFRLDAWWCSFIALPSSRRRSFPGIVAATMKTGERGLGIRAELAVSRSPSQRLALGALAAAVWYSRWVVHVWISEPAHRRLFPNDDSSGFAKFVAHALTYWLPSTVIVLAGWWALARTGVLVSSSRSLLTPGKRPLAVGGIATAALLAFTLVGAKVAGVGFQLKPEPWLMLGNCFSNMYEEIEYRGFLMTVLTAVTRRPWAAVVGSAVVFAMAHTQFPMPARLGVIVVGIIFGCAYERSGSLVAPWIAHQVGDMVGDTVLRM
jgi:membrane protease YdiL (CAAX protease family)